MIIFDGCSYRYSRKTPLETTAIKAVDLKLEKTQLTALMGRTGSGKTTLANLAAGLLEPEEGTVFVDELNTHEKRNRLKISRKVGLVFQYPEAQFFCPTVGEEIEFALKNFNIDNPNRVLTKQALENVGLNESYIDRNPFKLSGGEQRLVAIASIIGWEPDYLFFDEPTAGLDALSKKHVLSVIKQLEKYGKGVYVITHDTKLVKVETKRLVVLCEGRLYYDGDVRPFFEDPQNMKETGIFEIF
ncbi:MAG: ATP-binding cassette domain-containing protein [Thermotogota bacterium]|nr:ATP-binding cassette domain-containing protein [Thermotogota bacterium]